MTLLGLAIALLWHVQRSGMVTAQAILKIHRLIRGSIPRCPGLYYLAGRFAGIRAPSIANSILCGKGFHAKG